HRRLPDGGRHHGRKLPLLVRGVAIHRHHTPSPRRGAARPDQPHSRSGADRRDDDQTPALLVKGRALAGGMRADAGRYWRVRYSVNSPFWTRGTRPVTSDTTEASPNEATRSVRAV